MQQEVAVTAKVEPQIAFGFSSKVGTISSAALGIATAVDAILNSGALTTTGISTLAGAVITLASVIGIRGAQASAAVKAVGAAAAQTPTVVVAQPDPSLSVQAANLVVPSRVQQQPVRASQAQQEMDREPQEQSIAEDAVDMYHERRDIHEIDEKL